MDEKAIKALVHAVAPASIKIETFDEEHKVAMVPEGVRVVSLREFLPLPNRVKQKVTLLNVPSFVEYVNRFATAATTVFANETTGHYDAALDFHDPGTRGTLEHSASYACPQSEQWKAWVADNGKWFEQVEFAEFLEQNLREITEPPGAVFLQVALELQVHKSAQFASDVRLDNGQTKFRYEETVRGSTKAGDIEIPSEFTLRPPVFVDGKSHELKARFRYRMVEGKLTLGYQLIRHQDVWTDITRMLTLNGAQSAKGREMHLCPMQFDIADRVIAQFSMPGETVLDPFSGLGTVVYRALKQHRKGIGIELSHRYFLDSASYCKAMAQEVSMPSLFDLLDAEAALSPSAPADVRQDALSESSTEGLTGRRSANLDPDDELAALSGAAHA